MKPEKMFEVIGEVDEKFVAAAEYPRRVQGARAGIFLKLAAAACLIAVIGGSAWFVRVQYFDETVEFIGAEELDASDGLMVVADFLADYPSIFSFGILGEFSDMYFDVHGMPLHSPPLVRLEGDSISGGLVAGSRSDAPFTRERGTRVATTFRMYDLGMGIPLVTIGFTPLVAQRQLPLFETDTFWEIYKYVNGEFVQVIPEIFEWRLQISAQRYELPTPNFFRDEDGSFMLHLGTTHNISAAYLRVAITEGGMEIIEELPHRPDTQLTPLRMRGAEAEMETILWSRWSDLVEGFPQTQEILDELIFAYNELVRIFNGDVSFEIGSGTMRREWYSDYDSGWNVFMFPDEPHIQTVQDIHNLIDSVYAQDVMAIGARHMRAMLEGERALFRDMPSFSDIDNANLFYPDTTQLLKLVDAHWHEAAAWQATRPRFRSVVGDPIFITDIRPGSFNALMVFAIVPGYSYSSSVWEIVLTDEGWRINNEGRCPYEIEEMYRLQNETWHRWCEVEGRVVRGR
ncbi:MAG: hypothetical protein FWB96_04120 [Defluviitaleaceae bacterium]|nr:hypothetical protein [Defluviitaleaceae bacterium]MCL2262101.1 hypothetical protein [Defluviitaleaceae bacterium]